MKTHHLILIPFLLSLAACGDHIAPSVKHHPSAQTVTIDGEYKVGVVPQGGNVWVASGGMKGKEKHSDHWVKYRRERAIEIASGCRIAKVTSKAGEPLLRATVNCGGAASGDNKPINYYGKNIWKK